MESLLRQFILCEGQGVEAVRACVDRLREGLISGEDRVMAIRLEQVALLIADRYLRWAKERGTPMATIELRLLGEELEALGRSWPEGSIERLYALHNSATCFAQVNGDKPAEQLRLNGEVVTSLLGKDVEINDDTAEALLLRKVLAGLYEAGEDICTNWRVNYVPVVLQMVRQLDPDTLGRVEKVIKEFITNGRRDSARSASEEAERLLGTPEHFKPAQAARLRAYLDSLK